MSISTDGKESRRTGDTVAIAGGYQHRAVHQGRAPQRFWHLAKFSAARRLLDLRPGNRCLDVGCGSGVLAAALARDPRVHVTAVDGNPDAIAFASSHYRRRNLVFRQGLVDELDFSPASFDRITLLEVIEHLYPEQGRALLAALHRLLRPAGRLVVSTPNYRSLWPVIETALDTFGLVPPLAGEQHVAKYHVASLLALGRTTGFRVGDWRTINGLAPWAAPAGWRLARRIHRWETARRQPLGSVIVAAFVKP